MNMLRTDEVLTPEQQILMLLAYYDVREVPENKLRQIFNCEADHLMQARQDDDYKEYLAAEMSRVEGEAKEIDDHWDTLERRALGDLNDAIEAIGDPRMLLSIANSANRAQRRRGMVAQAQQKQNAVIDVDARTGNTTTVRLRTRFIEKLQNGGTEKLIERDAEITTSADNLHEDLTPEAMKSLLQNSVGIDTRDLKVMVGAGPDRLLEDKGAPFVDFNEVPLEMPDE